ncbi:hypothetical protein DFS34DRAFT_153403 [Phlyctochytrium arcticum]|nr:hypothetical protein DFS34DRAFT_153403 [Phlyctochytrium arcticum]
MSFQAFLQVDPLSDFPIENIPFGVIVRKDNDEPRIATALGSNAVDLLVLAQAGLFKDGQYLGAGVAEKVFSQHTLNGFMALGRPAWREARETIQKALSTNGIPLLRDSKELQAQVLIPLSSVRYVLPLDIGDYTDFYASKEHATNVGTMFRGKDNALMPNWVHLPVGYHGRASSVVVSGTSLKRPSGLILDPATKQPVYGASKKLDIELEVACVVGTGNSLGEPISIKNAEEHIFGLVLMNDWSARDIQQYEYVPLGPFLGKNFGTTISPWIVTLDALESFRVSQPKQDPQPVSYLCSSDERDAYDIKLEVLMRATTSSTRIPTTISRSNLKYMYWSFKQMLAHHTVNGCNMRTGDILGSGTISGPTRESLGSLLEMSVNGAESINLQDGSERTFLEDGDEVIIRGFSEGQIQGRKVRIGFGEAKGVILPAAPLAN